MFMFASLAMSWSINKIRQVATCFQLALVHPVDEAFPQLAFPWRRWVLSIVLCGSSARARCGPDGHDTIHMVVPLLDDAHPGLLRSCGPAALADLRTDCAPVALPFIFYVQEPRPPLDPARPEGILFTSVATLLAKAEHL